jgi:hypothetical protein
LANDRPGGARFASAPKGALAGGLRQTAGLFYPVPPRQKSRRLFRPSVVVVRGS